MSLTKAHFRMISGQPFNVKDYGAVGDGVADDTAAIQATINAANTAGGGTVYFPSGDYKTDSQITLESDIELRGDMNARLMPSSLVPAQAYHADSKNNIRIIGLLFEGVGTQYTFGTQRLVQFSSCSEIQIDGCTFRKSREIGVVIDNCSQGRMSSCLFENNYFYGAEVRNGSTSWVVSDCIFYENGSTGVATSAGGRGIVIWQATKINITNCTFTNQTEYGLRFYSQASDTITNQQCVVSNCTFENNGTTASGKVDLYFYNGKGTMETFAVTNCTFRTRSNNVSISVEGEGLAVSNCSFEDAGAGTATAFVFFSTDNVVVSNCVARDYNVLFSFSGTSIANNININNCQGINIGTVTQGIYGNNHVISNCYFIQSTAGAAALNTMISADAASAVNTRILNNVFQNCYRGIQINIGVTDAEISGNRFINTSDADVRCYGTDLSNLIFHDNVLDSGTNPPELGKFELRGGIDAQVVGALAAIPSVFSYRIGDRFYNTAPTAGTATDIGWVCTAAGTPGTWKGFGDIAS